MHLDNNLNLNQFQFPFTNLLLGLTLTTVIGIIYGQPNNKSFCDKIERVQYNAVLAVTGAVRGQSRRKLYKKIGFKSLEFRRWFKHLCKFFKIKKHGVPEYLN